ncbi:hypothetical protein ACLMJK_003984 [Lecanora helva]
MESRKETSVDLGYPGADVELSHLQNYRLSQPLESLAMRRCFLNRIFGSQTGGTGTSILPATDAGYDSYFSRYVVLCRLAANKHRGIEEVDHGQMASIITILHDRSLTKRAVVERCRGIIKDTVPLTYTDGSLNLVDMVLTDVAAEMWLMLTVGRFPGDISYDEPVWWEMDETQDMLLEKHFSSTNHSEDSVKLPQSFTAAQLEQIAGIEVAWTSNLADHLLLKDDDTKLMLFHQVSILQLHFSSMTSTLPKSLINETIRSVSLLIPPILGEPNPWFQQQRRKYRIDAGAGICDRLNSSERQIDKFLYWRDRLVLLKRTFDDAEPRNIKQLWFDDRKKTQWFTFWVAVLVFIMTVFFGVIQSVAGIVQAWASVQSLNSSNG